MSDDCITIESSDDDGIQVMEPSVVPDEAPWIKDRDTTKPKTNFQSSDSGRIAFTEFLRKCKEADPTDEDMDKVIKKMWKRFKEADESFTSSLFFIHLIEKLSDGVYKEPYSQLKSLSDELKVHTFQIKKRRVDKNENSTCNEQNEENRIDPKTASHIRKLEKIVAKLHEKIQLLEYQEIESSEDEDSAYIQESRYKERICQVFKKICELRNTSSVTNPLQTNIKFSGTRLPAVNKAIEKFYNERREFPDFHDVLTVVQKVNSSKSLNLTPGECQVIAEQSFTELGETLKKQRQFDFDNTLGCYLPDDAKDPAEENSDLKLKLDYHKKQYGNRIDEIIDKYAQKQTEENLEPVEFPSDALAESVDDDDDDDDEEESIGNVTSLSEPETDKYSEEEAIEVSDVEAKETFPSRECKIMLTQVNFLPEWEKYASKAIIDSEAGMAAHVCAPMPGCSKNISNDFCEKCSGRDSCDSSSSRKRNISSDDDSESSTPKKRKFNACPMADAVIGEKGTTTDRNEVFLMPLISSVTSMSAEGIAKLESEQMSLTNETFSGKSETSCSNTSLIVNLSAVESENTIGDRRSSKKKKSRTEDASEKVVDEVAAENDGDVISVDDLTDGSRTGTPEMAFVSVKDVPKDEPRPKKKKVRDVDTNEDEIMIIGEERNDERTSDPFANERSDKEVPKDIIDVEDLEDKSNNGERSVSRRCKFTDNEKLEIIDVEKIDRKKEKQDDIIDVERLPDETAKVNGIPMPCLSQVIRNSKCSLEPLYYEGHREMKFKFNKPGDNSISLTPIRPNAANNPAPGIPHSFGNRDSVRNSHTTIRSKFPITSTPKPYYNQRTNATAFTRHPNNMNMNRRSMNINNNNQRFHMGNRRQGSDSQRSFRPPLGGNRNAHPQQFHHQNQQYAQGAVQKRTTHTTEHKVIKNNIITKTTTVVEESVLRMDSNNSQTNRVAMGQNARFLLQGRYTARKHTQQIQMLRGSDTRSNSLGEDVITLD